jgi:hypothetical protein
MARTATAAMVTEAAKASVAPVFFVEMDFVSGFVRVWSGYGSISWDAKTWLGAGHLISIDTLSEGVDFVANGANLKLSGIPSEMIAIALGEQYQGRDATIYLGLLDSAGAVIADPLSIFAAKMDTMEIEEGGDTSSIIVRVESHAISLKRAHEWRYTHEDQLIDYPADRGLEYVAGLQDKELIWKPGKSSIVVDPVTSEPDLTWGQDGP